ncbi:hypothetical protein AD930_07980 [Acetobacter malorum]|nr:hypothetical protein AD930_07980 [Acetobacter malorum]
MMRLTKAEKEWLDRLQAVLSDAPSDRLGFYTIGDCDVFVFDKTRWADIENHIESTPKGMDFAPAVDAVGGGVVKTLVFPSNVLSVSG